MIFIELLPKNTYIIMIDTYPKYVTKIDTHQDDRIRIFHGKVSDRVI